MNKHFFTLLGLMVAGTSVQAGVADGVLAFKYEQYPTALAEFTYLQEEGNPVASYYLGLMYENGLGVAANISKAMALYRAADSGYYFPATARLGSLLLANGDIPTGISMLQKATLSGSSDAAFELAELYVDGQVVDLNLNQAFGYYFIAALDGNMKAQYQLGKMYLEGRGIPQDYQNAIKWLNRSANQGYLLAQVDLAELYANNKRLKNVARAYGWYSVIAAYNTDEIGQRAAEKRDILEKSIKKIDVLQKQQEMVRAWKPVEPAKTVPGEEKLQTKIPDIPGFNDPKTLQTVLDREGYLPRNGEVFGVTVDMVDTAIDTQNVQALIEQIEKAQNAGQTEAYGYLGDLYKTRLNNLTEAFLWYQKGAEKGDVYAQYQLAKMYCEGLGISQPDAAACYAWLLKVQESQTPLFNGLVQVSLSIVRSNATPDELQRGEKMLDVTDFSNTSTTEKAKKAISFL